MLNPLFAFVRRACPARARYRQRTRPLCLALALLTYGASAQALAQRAFDPVWPEPFASQTPDVTGFHRGNVIETGPAMTIFSCLRWGGRERSGSISASLTVAPAKDRDERLQLAAGHSFLALGQDERVSLHRLEKPAKRRVARGLEQTKQCRLHDKPAQALVKERCLARQRVQCLPAFQF